MAGFTKLFNSILYSTVWQEPAETKVVWITLLAMSDMHGEIQASVPGLAKAAGVTIDECAHALEVFASPDKYSRTPDFEGRRVEQIDGGWRLLNHGKYRALMSAEERKEYNRKKKEESRKKARAAMVGAHADVKEMSNMSNNVNECQQCQHITEADTDTDTESVSLKNNKSAVQAAASIPDQLQAIAGFISEWEAFKLHRRQKKAKMTVRAEELMLKKLNERPQSAILALQTAMVRGWQGFEWQWLENAPQAQRTAFQPEVRHDVIRPKTPPIKIN